MGRSKTAFGRGGFLSGLPKDSVKIEDSDGEQVEAIVDGDGPELAVRDEEVLAALHAVNEKLDRLIAIVAYTYEVDFE